MSRTPSRTYTRLAGFFLLLQGALTLAFRLVPALDQALPQLLATTRMMPLHSSLHILTGLLAVAALIWGGTRGTRWFAAGFGLFYTGLALFGMVTEHPTVLELQPFDHPFHLILGVLGLAVVAIEARSGHGKKVA